MRRLDAPADQTPVDVGPEAAGLDATPIVARRTDVALRLMRRGVSARVLEALLPGWEPAIQQAQASLRRDPSSPVS